MSVASAVEMIKATPHDWRSDFALSNLGKKRAQGTDKYSDVPF
jgi:hypothetical protein